MLLKLFLISGISFFSFIIIPQTTREAFPNNSTDIIIIGTVHYNTNNYNSDTLKEILDNIKPDVILVECDSSYMTPDFQLSEDIKDIFLETKAITKFLNEKHADLRPYDIPGRDLFLNDHTREKNQTNFFEDISILHRDNKLNDSALNIFNRVISMMNISEEMANSPATYINASEGSKKIDTINYYSYIGLDNLIKLTPELSPYYTYWQLENQYWNERNYTMLQNILNYEKTFAGKKIVVLCGFAHKNILKNGLAQKAKDNNFNVKEFWEY